jgi:predicted nucleic acid-binding protein
MKVLIDTNVVLDVLLDNSAFIAYSRKIFDFAEQKRITGYISASAITDIFYIAQRKLGKKAIKEAIKKVLKVFYPATVTDNYIYQALNLEWDDFEDSVQFTVGLDFLVDYIVTRDVQDFTSSSISAVTPEQFLQAVTDRHGT